MHKLFFTFSFLIINIFASDNIIPDLRHLGWDHEKEFEIWKERFKPHNLERAQANLKHPFHLAAANGNKKIVERCLEITKDVDLKNNENSTPLMFAAQESHLAIVTFLLDKGASTSLQGDRNDTPLHFAATKNQVEIVRTLLQAGAAVDAKNNNKSTPLMLAVAYGWIQNVSLLLEYKADINALDKDSDHALMYAKDFNMAHALLNYLPSFSHTLLCGKNKSVAKRFLLYGIPYSSKKKDNYDTVLESIITQSDSSQIFSQIENPKLLDEADELGNTPLFYAAAQERIETVKYLLARGVRTLVCNNNKKNTSQYVHHILQRKDLTEDRRKNYEYIAKLLHVHYACGAWALQQPEFVNFFPREMIKEIKSHI